MQIGNLNNLAYDRMMMDLSYTSKGRFCTKLTAPIYYSKFFWLTGRFADVFFDKKDVEYTTYIIC